MLKINKNYQNLNSIGRQRCAIIMEEKHRCHTCFLETSKSNCVSNSNSNSNNLASESTQVRGTRVFFPPLLYRNYDARLSSKFTGLLFYAYVETHKVRTPLVFDNYQCPVSLTQSFCRFFSGGSAYLNGVSQSLPTYC